MEINEEHGRRVQALRRRVGMSRAQLAKMSGLSTVSIKFIETHRRALTLRAAQAMAPHLNVRDLSELYGPSVTLSLDGRPSHPSVETVRQALTAWHIKPASGEPSSPEYLRGAVDSAWETWHNSRHNRSEVSALLPALLEQAQRAVRLLDGNDRRSAYAMLAQAYHLAQAYLAWHGDRELCWLTVDRGMNAALESDQPLAIAQATWYAAHLLRAVGRADEALERLNEAKVLVDPRVDGDPAAVEMMADLHLCVALTKARNGDVGAWHDWEQAKLLVHRGLPADFVGVRTRVSRPLVEVYGVMCAVDIGDTDEARRRAHDLDLGDFPSRERQARHLIELARAADLDGAPEAVAMLLRDAYGISPETVQFSPAARDMVTRLVTDGPAAVRKEALALAQGVGVNP